MKTISADMTLHVKTLIVNSVSAFLLASLPGAIVIKAFAKKVHTDVGVVCSVVGMLTQSVSATQLTWSSVEGTANGVLMYLWWSLCTLYLLACQVTVTIDD